MLQIDELKKKNGKLVELWSDGVCVAVMRQTDVYKNHIAPGTLIPEEVLAQLAADSMRKKAENRGAWMLSARDYSKKTMIERLSRVTGREAAEAAVEKFEQKGLINDERSAEHWAQTMLFDKLYSAKRTIFELCAKGIDKETAQNAVDSLEPDEDDQLDKLISKKYSAKLGDEAQIKKTFASLSRMGYNSYAIKRAVKRFTDREDFSDD
ncbi:MAG: regulatory protein RecX [Clostridia bacterium]|nr:regulatory protein RecX [Clostridia bacterium]